MASATETALQAFVALLQAASELPGPIIPAPLRNEALDTRFAQFGDGKAWLNVLDGDAGGSAEGGAENVALGAGASQFELSHQPKVEWVYSNADPVRREANFDLGLCAIYDALNVEGAIPGVTVTLAAVQRTNLNTDGMPATKSVLLTFTLTFVSSRPF